MRISVYKYGDGLMDVLAQAAPGKGRPPVLISRVTPENIKEKVLPLVNAMRLPKGAELDE